MPKLLHFWLVAIMCKWISFINFTSYHGSPSPLFYLGILVMFYLDAGSPQHIYQGIPSYFLILSMNIYWSKPIEKIIPNSIWIIFWRIAYMVSIKEEINQNPPLEYSGPLLVILSVSGNVDFGDTRQVSLLGYYFMWQYKWMRTENTNEQTIGDSWKDKGEMMRNFPYGCPNILWCACSDFWWCSEFVLLHHYGDLCQRFNKLLVWWIRLHHHRSKLNRIASMMISRYQYQPLTKAIFSGP